LERYRCKPEEVVFPESHEGKPVKTIEDCFSPNNKRIKHIIIPEGFTSIGKQAFEGCTELTYIELPESLTSIGEQAFMGCTGLIGIKLPESLASIKFSAFEGCTGLTTIKLPESFTSIDIWAFKDCTGITEIIVDKNNPVFCSLDGVMFDKAMTALMVFPEGKKGRYSVPDGIIRIKSSAFNGCGKLTGIFFRKAFYTL
jgi:hypothetical protein